MAIEAIKIPQNVQIEDRIIGPLTLRQILLVSLGNGFSYALFTSISKAYGLVSIPIQILVWVPGVLSIAFAFVRINDLSMLRLCMLMLERMNKPTVRIWGPRRGIIINIRTFSTPEKQGLSDKGTAEDLSKEKHFDEISALLDRPMEGESAAVKPVDPARIQVSKQSETSIDGVQPKVAVSVFSSPAPTTHV